jgi:hypothetical protein
MQGYFDSRQLADSSAYVSNSQINLILDSPKKYFAKYGEKVTKPETAAMREGRILHSWVLEPELFDVQCLISPFKDFRTNLAKEWREEVITSVPNAVILTEREREEYAKIIEAVYSDPVARGLLKKSANEKHGYATDPKSGLTLYSRPDFITTDGIIGDLKFVESSNKVKFTRAQFFDGYYIQGAFYTYVDSLIRGGATGQNFLYIAVEKTYPHIVQVYTLSPVFEKMAQKKIEKGIELIKMFKEIDPGFSDKSKWPGYSGMVEELGPTYSMLASDDDFSEFIQIGGV